MMSNNLKNIAYFTVAFALVSYFYIDRFLAFYFHENVVGLHHLVWEYITEFGDAQYPIIISIVMLLFYKFNKYIYYVGLLMLSSVLLSGVITNFLKFFFGRSRPKMLIDEGGIYTFKFFAKYEYSYISFPSGHTATAFSIGVALALLYPRYKFMFLFFAIIVGMSRVVLQKHFLSDVLIGGLIGAMTSIYLYEKFFKKKVDIS